MSLCRVLKIRAAEVKVIFFLLFIYIFLFGVLIYFFFRFCDYLLSKNHLVLLFLAILKLFVPHFNKLQMCCKQATLARFNVRTLTAIQFIYKLVECLAACLLLPTVFVVKKYLLANFQNNQCCEQQLSAIITVFVHIFVAIVVVSFFLSYFIVNYCYCCMNYAHER